MKEQNEILTTIHTLLESIETLNKMKNKKGLKIAIKKLVKSIESIEIGK
jgi:hypothetical protein